MTLAPESIELLGVIAPAERFTLSCTSTYEMARDPWGLIDHAVPPDVERRDKSCPAAPCSVRVPVVVCVVPAVKLSVSADATLFVRL